MAYTDLGPVPFELGEQSGVELQQSRHSLGNYVSCSLGDSREMWSTLRASLPMSARYARASMPSTISEGAAVAVVDIA